MEEYSSDPALCCRRKNWFLRLLCRHRRRHNFIRNIYGDEINHSGGKRSLWVCHDCGHLLAKDKLQRDLAGRAL